jgi:hypothetical protein
MVGLETLRRASVISLRPSGHGHRASGGVVRQTDEKSAMIVMVSRALSSAALATSLALGLCGCGGFDDPFADDCLPELSYGDAHYVFAGYTSNDAEPLSERATVTACASAGHEQVSVSRVPSFPADQVLVVQTDRDVYTVLINRRDEADVLARLRDAGVLNAGEQ